MAPARGGAREYGTVRDISRREWLVTSAAGVLALAVAGTACSGDDDGDGRGAGGDDEEGGDVSGAYGPEDLQRGDLILAGGDGPAPVVVLLHGGYWYPGYGRDLMEPLARDLAGRRYATWNLDYRPARRTSGWPYLLEDVAAGVDHLLVLAEEHPGALDLDRVVLVGHSAGGQLALWAAARHRLPAGSPGAAPELRPKAVVAQAPVADLVAGAAANLGTGAVQRFLGGEPDAVPDRYAVASPLALVPSGVPTLLVHGQVDLLVPLAQSRQYQTVAREAGDDVDLVVVEDADHFEVINPDHQAWATVVDRLPGLLG